MLPNRSEALDPAIVVLDSATANLQRREATPILGRGVTVVSPNLAGAADEEARSSPARSGSNHHRANGKQRSQTSEPPPCLRSSQIRNWNSRREEKSPEKKEAPPPSLSPGGLLHKGTLAAERWREISGGAAGRQWRSARVALGGDTNGATQWRS